MQNYGRSVIKRLSEKRCFMRQISDYLPHLEARDRTQAIAPGSCSGHKPWKKWLR